MTGNCSLSKEVRFPPPQRTAIYVAVCAAGGFAWEDNAKDRAAKLIRIIPPGKLDIRPNKLWPDYQRELAKAESLTEQLQR